MDHRVEGDVVGAVDAFRDGMSRVASAVHIITTDGPMGRAGLTMTAMMSLSAEPPMLVISIKRDSSSAPAVIGNGIFSVNTLRDSQKELADIFAGRSGLVGEARFSSEVWTIGATGAPILPNSLVTFDCRIVGMREVATHVILIGEVAATRPGVKGQGLVYADRGYHSV